MCGGHHLQPLLKFDATEMYKSLKKYNSLSHIIAILDSDLEKRDVRLLLNKMCCIN